MLEKKTGKQILEEVQMKKLKPMQTTMNAEKEWIAVSDLENATLQELSEVIPSLQLPELESVKKLYFLQSESVLGLKNRLDKLLVSLEKAETLSTGYCLDREINEVKEIVREMNEKTGVKA